MKKKYFKFFLLGHENLIDTLTRTDVDVDNLDEDRRTALFYAVNKGSK